MPGKEIIWKTQQPTQSLHTKQPTAAVRLARAASSMKQTVALLKTWWAAVAGVLEFLLLACYSLRRNLLWISSACTQPATQLLTTRKTFPTIRLKHSVSASNPTLWLFLFHSIYHSLKLSCIYIYLLVLCLSSLLRSQWHKSSLFPCFITHSMQKSSCVI